MKIKLLSIAVVAFALSACGNDKTSGQTSDTSTQKTPQKNLIIATESSFKPFSYLDNQGNLVGFEIDLARALCTQMQATCDIQSQDWDSLIPSLQANKSDAIMAGMSATPERIQVVDFSEPYFNNTLVLIGKKGDDTTIKDIAGKTVATQQATVSADYITKHKPDAHLKTYDKQDNAYLDLSAGRADFMLSDIVPALDWLKTDAGQGFEVKGEPIDVGDTVAVAVRKGDALGSEFSRALKTLKENGTYDEIAAKYFDNQDPDTLQTGSTATPSN